jgi:LacI family transcriptional regulator
MSRRPTIIDVARVAGVSKSTVSRVIRGDDSLVRERTREKVLRAIDELGYERNAVAGSLRTNRTFTIVLIIPDIANPFWPEVARGVQDVVSPQGYALVLACTDWHRQREQEYLAMARRNRFDGIMINPSGLTNDDLKQARMPVVILGLGGDQSEFDAVGSDSYTGTTIALEYLMGLGHQRIGLISGQSNRVVRSSRLASYLDFYRDRGMHIDAQLIVECPFDQECGRASMHKLLAVSPPPTAVFAANDILAIGALHAIQEAGLRVPEDVSIVGMDDTYAVSVTTPPLTTIAKHKYDTGRQAATFLLERIHGSAPPEARRYEEACRLVVRGSTMSPG